jgi:hypothetical protein
MRLFLDAHLSGRSIGRPLRAQGHDVRVVDEEHDLNGLDDELLLSLASNDARILITVNAKDFLRIVGRWAESGSVHAGCMLIPYTFRQDQFGAIVTGISVLLDRTADQEARRDRVEWLMQ